jgi:hypothetical protein
MVALGEKLRRVPWATQLILEVESGALFLRSSSIHPALLGLHERLPLMVSARRKRASGVGGLTHEAYLSCVSDFPYMVYIYSNHRKLSDISNRLFVAVNTYLMNEIIFINELMTLIYINTYIATFVWLSSGSPCLKFNQLSRFVKV